MEEISITLFVGMVFTSVLFGVLCFISTQLMRPKKKLSVVSRSILVISSAIGFGFSAVLTAFYAGRLAEQELHITDVAAQYLNQVLVFAITTLVVALIAYSILCILRSTKKMSEKDVPFMLLLCTFDGMVFGLIALKIYDMIMG